jgi:hypothetical protein
VIDFFELDTREDLLEGRAQIIMLLFPQLEASKQSDPETRQRAAAFVATLQEVRFPHAACARSYVGLYHADRERARDCYEAARTYLTRKEPSVLLPPQP